MTIEISLTTPNQPVILASPNRVQAGNTETILQGPPGPTGPDGPQGPVGPSVIWRGTWSVSTAYVVNDGVYYQGSSYVCSLADTGHAPPTLPATANSYWQLLAQRGDDATVTANTQQFVGNNTAGPYTLSAVPKPNSLQVSINGLEQDSTHFSVSGNALFFGDVVEATDSITIHYLS